MTRRAIWSIVLDNASGTMLQGFVSHRLFPNVESTFRAGAQGFYAPGVMLTLLLVGASGIAAGLALLVLTAGWLGTVGGVLASASLGPLGLGLSMVAYGLVGKRRPRRRPGSGVASHRGCPRVLVPRRLVRRGSLALLHHNIERKHEQRAACLEIARVLKPGGRVLVGGWLPTHAYADAFRGAGLSVNGSRTDIRTALSPMWLVDAEKPPARLEAAATA